MFCAHMTQYRSLPILMLDLRQLSLARDAVSATPHQFLSEMEDLSCTRDINMKGLMKRVMTK